MKKAALITLSIVTLMISCKCKKVTSDIVTQEQATVSNVTPSENKVTNNEQQAMIETEYEANTRGFYLKVKYSNGVVYFTNQRGSDLFNTVSLTKAQAKELDLLLDGVALENLPNLKDPSQKRFYDGAAIANLKITKSGKEFKTVDFDHGNPPAEIAKLIEKLVSYTVQE